MTINSTYLDSDSFVVGRVGVDRDIVVGVAGIEELWHTDQQWGQQCRIFGENFVGFEKGSEAASPNSGYLANMEEEALWMVVFWVAAFELQVEDRIRFGRSSKVQVEDGGALGLGTFVGWKLAILWKQ